MVFCTSHVEKLSPKCVDFWLARYCYCCSYLYYVIVLVVWSTPVSVLELVWWISLSVYVGNLQKLCKTLDGDQALREAKEREDEKTVNDEEMAERSVNTLTTYCSAVAECRRSVMPHAQVDHWSGNDYFSFICKNKKWWKQPYFSALVQWWCTDEYWKWTGTLNNFPLMYFIIFRSSHYVHNKLGMWIVTWYIQMQMLIMFGGLVAILPW